MSEPNSQGEPTMEEILASIRKIISEDGPDAEAEAAEAEAPEALEEPVAEPPAPAPQKAEAAREEVVAETKAAEPAAEDEDVLDLTQEVKEDGTVVDLNAKRDEPAAARPEPEPEAAEPLSELELSDADDMASPAEQPQATEPQAAEPQGEEPGAAEPDFAAVASAAALADEPVLVSGETRDAATASLVELAMTAGLGAAGRYSSGAVGQTLEMLVRDALQPYLKSWLDENLAPLVERIVREEIQKMVKRAEYR